MIQKLLLYFHKNKNVRMCYIFYFLKKNGTNIINIPNVAQIYCFIQHDRFFECER